jgi:hypothetical protein
MSAQLRHDSKAWDEGFKAGEVPRFAWDEGFKAGEVPRFARCPYPAGSIEAWSWHSGFIEGDAKRQGFSYSGGSAK